MDNFQKLITFLTKLDDTGIFYKLDKIRDSIMVEIAVPGQRWEVEFMYDGTIETEKYISDGKILDEQELEVFFRDFTD